MKRTPLVLAITLLATQGGHPQPATAAAPEAPASGTLALALQGLMAVSEGQVDTGSGPTDVLWAWMIDTRDPAGANRPPCVAGPIDPHDYPLHVPVLWVEGGAVTDETGTGVGNLIDLADQDVVIDTGRQGFGAIDLAALVSADELVQAGLDPANALPEVLPALLVSAHGSVAAPLVTRVRILGADSVAALADTCGPARHYTLAPGVDSCAYQDPGAPFAHEVRLAQAAVTGISVHLRRRDGSSARTLTITPTASTLEVSVRNVMAGFEAKPIDHCSDGMDHLAAYRWFYALTDYGSLPQTCSLVPCQVAGTSGGFKCPIPNPGGP